MNSISKLSFIDSSTSLREESRPKLNMPYVHHGERIHCSASTNNIESNIIWNNSPDNSQNNAPATADIFYDPDSADDLDDEDPDEDLNF